MDHAGAYWRVRGARRDSGLDVEVLVRAADREGAEHEAQRLGILTNEIHEVPLHAPARAEAVHGPEGAAREIHGERLVGIYATRPRDHLYIGWALRHRRHLVVTSHRIILHERSLLSSKTTTVDRGAVEGVFVGGIVRWRLLILTLVVGFNGIMPLPLVAIGSPKWGLRALALLGIAVLTGLLLSRADFMGVLRAGARVGILRYGIPPEVREQFLHDVHSILHRGHDRGLLRQLMSDSLRAHERVCPSCRYPLTGLEHATVCPECGAGLPAADVV